MSVPNLIGSTAFPTNTEQTYGPVNSAVNPNQRMMAALIPYQGAFGGITRAGFLWLEVRDAQLNYVAVETKPLIVGLRCAIILPAQFAGSFYQLRYIPMDYMPPGGGNFYLYQVT